MSRLDLFNAMNAADLAWRLEIARVFGEADAGRARCQGRADGELGSRLRELCDRYGIARSAYRSARA